MCRDFCKLKTTYLNLQFKNGMPLLNKSNHVVQLMDARMQDYPVECHSLLRATSLQENWHLPHKVGVDLREVVGRIWSIHILRLTKVKKNTSPYRSKVFCLLFRMSTCQHQTLIVRWGAQVSKTEDYGIISSSGTFLGYQKPRRQFLGD